MNADRKNENSLSLLQGRSAVQETGKLIAQLLGVNPNIAQLVKGQTSEFFSSWRTWHRYRAGVFYNDFSGLFRHANKECQVAPVYYTQESFKTSIEKLLSSRDSSALFTKCAYACHFWQRARQNCVYIEIGDPGNKIGMPMISFVGLRLISLYRCEGTFRMGLLAFNFS